MEAEQERAVRLTKEAMQAIEAGDNTTARQLLESLEIKREDGFQERVPFTLKFCADITLALQDFERSATFYGVYLKQWALLGQPLPEPEREQIAAGLEELQSRLGEAAYKRAYSTGKLMTLEQGMDAAARFCADPFMG